MSDAKRIVCTDAVLARTSTSIDIVSIDIGTINMGVARIRYDYASGNLCILNAMLLSIFNPFQMLNDNDAGHDETTTFPVDAYYAQPPSDAQRAQDNTRFSQQQLLSRKRARITEKNDATLQFATDMHPSNGAKRRRTKLNAPQIPAALAENWALIGAQLTLALQAHAWISENVDFLLVEQQDRSNPKARAVSLAIVTFFETKRHMCLQQANGQPQQPQPQQQQQQQQRGGHFALAPFIKVCSASNKLAHATVAAMRTSWTTVSVHDASTLRMTPVQVKALLKKHFLPPATQDTVNTETYSKRKISSKDEITSFFCRASIESARAKSLADGADRTSRLPATCAESIVERVAQEPVNAYAHWIVNQLQKKNNVTDALLQAFSWIQQCDLPANPN
jgi:hypothetical protein